MRTTFAAVLALCVAVLAAPLAPGVYSLYHPHLPTRRPFASRTDTFSSASASPGAAGQSNKGGVCHTNARLPEPKYLGALTGK
ncbi:hypothetical protein BDK51DRAFT_44286 [Blyttiomyces helicus]|uniref:Uncharacterized protein n=1 Tax=Blyttiomyces helicus TaxID=388810 RepID=A0A4P9WJZ8_9FUNG|nr:hypothetical protein BDK51DRAFT_44286 [Blyttiomyces helicus]|eukprot:RKO90996.1 hypothetical protein BDK51DRAFT_44286 [Blyttiomyces helicus]